MAYLVTKPCLRCGGTGQMTIPVRGDVEEEDVECNGCDGEGVVEVEDDEWGW